MKLIVPNREIVLHCSSVRKGNLEEISANPEDEAFNVIGSQSISRFCGFVMFFTDI